jgi:hypothetical protein
VAQGKFNDPHVEKSRRTACRTFNTLSKAVVSREARRRLRYVELLSDARRMLANFFSVLLNQHGSEGRKWKNGAHQNS